MIIKILTLSYLNISEDVCYYSKQTWPHRQMNNSNIFSYNAVFCNCQKQSIYCVVSLKTKNSFTWDKQQQSDVNLNLEKLC